MNEDFNGQLFQKVCELEARLELEGSKRYELERLLKEAVIMISHTGLTDYNTDWYLRAKKELNI
jgi:hypothetical protein